MLSWLNEIESTVSFSSGLLLATLLFIIITIVMVILAARKSKKLVVMLSEKNDHNITRLKSLEKAAESIRKELLEAQQHQDINQLQLKSSKSSAAELRQALLDARKRLEIAEAAVKAKQEQIKKEGTNESTSTEFLDLEIELDNGLTESQREQLIDLLDPGPKGNIDIFCIMNNSKSELAAKQIEEIIANDGWKTNGVAHSAFSTPPAGIVLAVNSKETAPSYASFLQRVFSTIGMNVSAKFDSKYREWSLTVIVGTLDD